MPFRAWGFKSPLRHQRKIQLTRARALVNVFFGSVDRQLRDRRQRLCELDVVGHEHVEVCLHSRTSELIRVPLMLLTALF